MLLVGLCHSPALTLLRLAKYPDGACLPWFGDGKPAPCCANRTHILYDVPCNVGKLPTFPGDPSTIERP